MCLAIAVKSVTSGVFYLKWDCFHKISPQATGLDAWASRVKCPARFVSHLHDIYELFIAFVSFVFVHYCNLMVCVVYWVGKWQSRGSTGMFGNLMAITDLYQIDLKQRRSRPSDRKSRAPGADRPRPQREFARAPLAASNSTDTTAFATGYIACTVHRSLNIVLQTTWLCTQT